MAGYPTRASVPNGAFGYWRGVGGGDFQGGGSGSGMGMANQGTGTLSQGIGNITSGWEPSILYLLGLVVAEMVAFHVIGRILK